MLNSGSKLYINRQMYWTIHLHKREALNGMIHRCITVLQYDTGIDTTFNVSIYRVSQ